MSPPSASCSLRFRLNVFELVAVGGDRTALLDEPCSGVVPVAGDRADYSAIPAAVVDGDVHAFATVESVAAPGRAQDVLEHAEQEQCENGGPNQGGAVNAANLPFARHATTKRRTT